MTDGDIIKKIDSIKNVLDDYRPFPDFEKRLLPCDYSAYKKGGIYYSITENKQRRYENFKGTYHKCHL